MHVRITRHKRKSGGERRYAQLVESYRRDDGMPATRVVAHLGQVDDLLVENLRAALRAHRQGDAVVAVGAGQQLCFEQSLQYLPVALIVRLCRQLHISQVLDRLCERPKRAATVAQLVEALVAHRCLSGGSKLEFQRWLSTVACQEVFGQQADRFSNTRVHRSMDELARIDDALQQALATHRFSQGRPRLIYLDLSDTWFVAGGGSLSRRGSTKEGHRNKLKIHIALLVDAKGRPLRWQLLPGALNESTILGEWVERVRQWPELDEAVLIFDRGMQSVANFEMLVGPRGHLFLSCVRATTISSYVNLDDDKLDELQQLSPDAAGAEIDQAAQRLGLRRIDPTTYVRSLGIVEPPSPRNASRRPPKMRMYLYFNPQMQQVRRQKRKERIDSFEKAIDELNESLRSAKKSRGEQATRKKVDRLLAKYKLAEVYDVELESMTIEKKRTTIKSWQVVVEPNVNRLVQMRRHDGLTLLVGHPDIDWNAEKAVQAYRDKAAVEADFRTIKSVLKVRPTFHWTDAKIRAHVTLCVLALLVERFMEIKLAEADEDRLPRTAPAALAELDRVRLNRLTVANRRAAARVQADELVCEILDALGHRNILDEAKETLKLGGSDL